MHALLAVVHRPVDELAQEPTRPMSFRPSSRLAAWAPAAPVLCAVHCLATPLLVSLLPALGVAEAADGWLFALVLLIAASSLRSELPAHGQWRVLFPVTSGFALWAASLAGWPGALPEELTLSLGSLTAAGGMFWSARLRHRATCRDCGCPASLDSGAAARLRGGAA